MAVRRVNLRISGPRDSWGESVVVATRSDVTWNELFEREMTIVLPNRMEVRPTRYRRPNHRNNQVYCAQLNDQVINLINYFRTRREIYDVEVFDTLDEILPQQGGANLQPVNPVNVLNSAVTRLSNVPEYTLREISAEYEALRQDGGWREFFQSAPMCFHLLQTLFRN